MGVSPAERAMKRQPKMDDLERAFDAGLTGTEAWDAAVKRSGGQPKTYKEGMKALCSDDPNSLTKYADKMREEGRV